MVIALAMVQIRFFSHANTCLVDAPCLHGGSRRSFTEFFLCSGHLPMQLWLMQAIGMFTQSPHSCRGAAPNQPCGVEAQAG